MMDIRPNDRVWSTVFGYYYGLPGTVRRLAQIQYGNYLLYLIDLDCGESIVLAENHLMKID